MRKLKAENHKIHHTKDDINARRKHLDARAKIESA